MESPSFCILDALDFDKLCETSFVVKDNFFSLEAIDKLTSVFDKNRDSFKPAKIGAGSQSQNQQSIRGDLIYWWEEDDSASSGVLTQFRSQYLGLLRTNLHLPIFNLELHWAMYPEGRGYETHIDQTPQKQLITNRRLVSFVVYLNKNWSQASGGELELWPNSSRSQKIEPIWNRAVFFLSEVVPHRVCSCTNERRSLTGWFKTMPQ